MSGDPSNSRLERSGWADRSAEPIDREITPPSEVQAYYAGSPEESRLEFGAFRLEFERTKEILARVLPAAPARTTSAARQVRIHCGSPSAGIKSISSTPRRGSWTKHGREARNRQHRSCRFRLPTLGDCRRRATQLRRSSSWGRSTISRWRLIGWRHFVRPFVSWPGMALRWWRPSRVTPRPWTAWRENSPWTRVS